MHKEEEFIDFKEIFLSIWGGRRFIIRLMGVFGILGLVIAFTTPSEYVSRVTLIIENDQAAPASSSLSSLAGLAGINLGSTRTEGSINPLLYPNVVTSSPYLVSLMNRTFEFRTIGQTTSLKDYFLNHQEQSLIGLSKAVIKYPIKQVKSWIKGDVEQRLTLSDSSWVMLDEEEKLIALELQSRILLTVDATLGLVEVTVELQDKYVAAEIAQYTMDYITDYVTTYRLSKLRDNLLFIESRTAEAEQRFLSTQDELARFRDANKNLVVSTVESQLQVLNSQYNLAFGLYNSLAQQLEQAKIKVQEQKPLFKILEPVNIPLERSSPKRTLILIVFLFLGFFAGISWLIGKMILANFKHNAS